MVSACAAGHNARTSIAVEASGGSARSAQRRTRSIDARVERAIRGEWSGNVERFIENSTRKRESAGLSTAAFSGATRPGR
jgi:hypothetical protein